MTRRRHLASAVTAALFPALMASAARAQAPEPALPLGATHDPPPFEPPTFAPPTFAPPSADEPPPDTGAEPAEPGAATPAPGSSLVLEVDAGARYRRLYGADISAFELDLMVGRRIRPHFHVGGFALGAIGATQQGLQTRFFSLGAELAFPLATRSRGFLGRLTPALRFRINYADIARITRPGSHFSGVGVGADAQMAVDLFREQTHALYAVGRVGLEGYLTSGEGLSLLSTFAMWGGSLGAGFRY